MFGLFSAFAPSQIFAAGAAPVGIDLGSDAIRLAQVSQADGAPELVAAAMRDVPTHLHGDHAGYAAFASRTIRELWKEGRFSGRKAVIGLPSPVVHLLHLRLPKLDADSTKSALAGEVAGKIPFDPISAMLRHHSVGDVYTNDGPRQEVICTATRRDIVELFLSAAERAKVEVTGLVSAPIAIRDCFARIFKRQEDVETGYCFVDIGRTGTRIVISRASHLYFARSIPVGGMHIDQAVAKALKIEETEARLLRFQLAEGEGRPERDAETVEIGESGGVATMSPARASVSTELSVASATESVTEQLAEEIERCRRYHETTFPNVTIDRLIFVGGEAHQRKLCQAIARRLNVAAKVGDPIAKLTTESHVSRVDFASAGIDRRQSQPGWAVACGLTLGAMH